MGDIGIIIVYLIYGLAFFMLAVGIVSRSLGMSHIKFAKPLLFLAIFGFIHGLDEYLDLLIILGVKGTVEYLHTIFNALSYTFLMFFAIEILSIFLKLPILLRLSPFFILVGWLIIYIGIENGENKHIMGEVLSRYFIGFPAGFVSGYVIIHYRNKIAQNVKAISNSLLVAGIFLIAYAFFTIVSHKLPYLPANIINNENFTNIIGIPVQVFRAICAIGILISFVRSLEILDIEARKSLEKEISKKTREYKEKLAMKTLLIDIVRHDMLNILGVAKSYLDFSRDAENKNEQKMLLEKASDSIKRAIDFIERIKRLSMLEEIRDIETKEISLKNLIESSIEGLKPYIERENMEVVFKPKGDYKVVANPILEEAFQNIIMNAIKYAKEGKKLIIEVKELEDRYQIYFKDFGPGIPNEFKKTIFERFERGSKKGIKGAGLGLAITKRIVELHKGKIWVEDNKPKGSIFVIEIPKFSNR